MPRVRIKQGADKGQAWEIGTTPLLLGRDPRASIPLSDKGASRQHAEIFRVGEMCLIKDLGSRNGTFVNDEPIEEELLQHGDCIRIGSTELTFESGEPGEEELERQLEYQEEKEYKTTLELRLDDLYVGDSESSAGSQNFRAVCQAAQILQTERDEKILMDRILALIADYLPADYLFIFLRDEATGNIVRRAFFERASSRGGSVPISRTILKRVVAEKRSILTSDAMSDERFAAGESVMMGKIRSVICVPLVVHAQVIGALYATTLAAKDSFVETDLELVTALGSHLAMALENLQTARKQRQMLMNIIGTLVAIAEMREPGSASHSQRVARFARSISEALGQTPAETQNAVLAGMLHDIGKLVGEQAARQRTTGIYDPALRDEEHLIAGARIAEKIQGLSEIIPALKSHHERFDGKGYPEGLKGNQIPQIARIITVANEFDRALYYGGPAGKGLPLKDALAEMGNLIGEVLCPTTTRALMVAYRQGRLEVPGRKKEPATEPPPSENG